MKLIRDIKDLPSEARGGAVTIGNFDGVHRGHLEIVRRLRARADAVGGPAVVFTFDPHPVRLLRPEECPAPLTWTERKAELLVTQGVDWMVAYPTDKALLGLSARQFFDKIIGTLLGAKSLVEGVNFFFGNGREGNIDLLRAFAGETGIDVEIVDPVLANGEVVSSSRVRVLIADGDVAAAHNMLSAPYRVRGIVTHGAGRGATLGFPTANLVGVDTLLPAVGVYAGRGWLGEHSWPAAINIGPNPTFDEQALKVEAHLVGRSEPLYGQILEVDFFSRLRDIRPFGSADELTEQLKKDVLLVEEFACGER